MFPLKAKTFISIMILLLLFAIRLQAQNYLEEIKNETKTYINNCDSLINAGEYLLAIKESDKLKYGAQMLYGLFLDEEIIPKELGNYKIILETRSNDIDDKGIELLREYARMNVDSSFNTDIKITLLISNKNEVINKIANINAFTYNFINNDNQVYKPVDVKGNRALLVFDRNRKFSSVAIALSNYTTVRINIEGVADYDLVLKISELINYDRIKTLLP